MNAIRMMLPALALCGALAIGCDVGSPTAPAAMEQQGNVFRVSADGGLASATIPNGTPGFTFTMVAAVPGRRLFAGARNAIYSSTDDASGWMESAVVSDPRFPDLLYPISLAESNGTLFIGTSGAGVYSSTDNGASWRESGLAETMVQSIIARGDGLLVAIGRYYSAISSEIYTSRDQGATWQSGGKLGTGTTTTLLAAPSGALFAGMFDLGVYRSRDDGRSWQPVVAGLADRDVKTLALGPDGTLYAGTFAGTIFRSRDEGGSWEKIADNSIWRAPVSSLHVGRDGVLYAATVGKGIYTLQPGGSTWSYFALNGLAINRIVFGETGELFAATSAPPPGK